MVVKKLMPLHFEKKEFEDEYRLKSLNSLHEYTRNLSYLFALTAFILLVCDIVRAPEQVPIVSIAVFGITIIVMLGYVAFARKYDFRNWAGYVAGAVVAIFGGGVVVNLYPCPFLFLTLFFLHSSHVSIVSAFI
jgi:hypothetical protein